MMQSQLCPPCCSPACPHKTHTKRHFVELLAALPSSVQTANGPPVSNLITACNEPFSWGIITIVHSRENCWPIKVRVDCAFISSRLWSYWEAPSGLHWCRTSKTLMSICFLLNTYRHSLGAAASNIQRFSCSSITLLAKHGW